MGFKAKLRMDQKKTMYVWSFHFFYSLVELSREIGTKRKTLREKNL